MGEDTVTAPPLTSGTISQKFSDGEEIEISAAEDYNTLITYLNSNPSSNNMRNVRITSDLDFENKDIIMYNDISMTNITIDGGNHILKNIVKTSISNSRIFFSGYPNSTSQSSGAVLKNITFSNCYMQNTKAMYVFYGGCLENVKIEKCRFSSGGSISLVQNALTVSYFSSSATVVTTGTYYGIYGGTYCKTDHTALVNNVSYSGTSTNASAYSVYTAGSSTSFVYTRDKFKNFAAIYGIRPPNGSNYVTMSYAAISSDDAVSKNPFYTASGNAFTASYYDNTLVPNASLYTDLGVPTEVLQSIAEMTKRGWFVEAV